MLGRFGIAPTDSFTWVTDASLCRRAVAEIVRDAEISADSFTIVLARTGAYYVAESDRDMKIWGRTFVFDSTLALFLPRDTLMSFSNARPPATESLCFGPEEDFSKMVLGRIRFTLTDPRMKSHRDLLGFGGVPVDSVHHVADDTMCARAIAAIKAHQVKAVEHVKLTLFRVGRYHWAETSWPAAGEWTLVFIMDSTATKVLGQY